ncbi:hypothetical protein EWB00_007644 [Schistosoma japonicum]|uniref:Uncharacterized protein n=1 Tax=Schistosoma japonicum TaxID=6182 RepID=A0A4Z2CU01_SCHJA|nr:hypothetical protein EWB00_007644 [Schistosoma japonicum]
MTCQAYTIQKLDVEQAVFSKFLKVFEFSIKKYFNMKRPTLLQTGEKHYMLVEYIEKLKTTKSIILVRAAQCSISQHKTVASSNLNQSAFKSKTATTLNGFASGRGLGITQSTIVDTQVIRDGQIKPQFLITTSVDEG